MGIFKRMGIFTVIVGLAFGIGALITKPTACGASCGLGLISVNALEFSRAVNQHEATLIDVRTAEEFAGGHITGAINYDFNNINLFKKQLESLDRNQRYLIYCRSGNRSGQALEIMESMGFAQVQNLEDGIQGWQAAGLPLEK